VEYQILPPCKAFLLSGSNSNTPILNWQVNTGGASSLPTGQFNLLTTQPYQSSNNEMVVMPLQMVKTYNLDSQNSVTENTQYLQFDHLDGTSYNDGSYYPPNYQFSMQDWFSKR